MRERGQCGVGARHRVGVWCVWSAVLAAMPYFRASLDAAPMAVAPGQAPDVPVALALLVVLVWGVARSGGVASHPARMARRTVELVGLAATVALVIVEAVLCANRGFPYLDDARVAVYESVGMLEMPLATLALTGWALWGAGLGVDPVGSSALLLGVFAGGALWPCLCALGVVAPWWQPAAFSVIAGACSAVLALLAVRALCSRGMPPGAAVVPFLSGQLAFVLVRAIDRENQWEGLGELLPTSVLYVAFALAILAYAVALGLVLRLRKRVRWERVTDAHEMPDGARVADVLRHRSKKLLTERELAVLVRTARGDTAQTIAAELGIAEATVATYRRRGYEKLGVSGAEELRALAADAETSVDVADEEDDASGANATPARTGLRLRPSHVLLLLVLVALPMIPWPEELEVVSGYWVSGVGLGKLSALLVALATVLFGVSLSCLWVAPSDPEETEGPFLPTASRLYLMVIAVLLGVFVFHSWCGYGDYELSGVVLLALLTLLSLVHSAYEEHQREFGKEVLARALATVDLLSRDGAWYPCISAGVVLSLGSETIWFEAFAQLYVIRYPLAFAACLLMFVAIAHTRKRMPGKETPISEGCAKRTIMYLEGRGLGELQAQVLLDLASGYGVNEVAARRCTTVATVRSYRQRSYDALGVHSMSELRKLLSREAGFTSNRKLHPNK